MAKQRVNVKQAPSKADRVFLAMQKPLKRAAKSIVKDQRRSDRDEAAREKARQAELASEPEVPPYPGLDSLEVQARFAMNTITLARVALLAGECVDSDERDAAANLLWSAEVFLSSLDLERVALDKARARREAREAATRDRKAA